MSKIEKYDNKIIKKKILIVFLVMIFSFILTYYLLNNLPGIKITKRLIDELPEYHFLSKKELNELMKLIFFYMIKYLLIFLKNLIIVIFINFSIFLMLLKYIFKNTKNPGNQTDNFYTILIKFIVITDLFISIIIATILTFF